MHILPGVLTLLLLPAAVQAAPPYDKLIGEWGGTVTSDDGCEWRVRASIRMEAKGPAGNFTLSGDCAEEAREGTFKVRMTGKTCFASTAEMAGMPPVPMTGCSDKAGASINFKTVGMSGKLTPSKSGNALALTVKAERGGAKGQFRRMTRKKRGAPPKERPPREEDGGGDRAGNWPDDGGGEGGGGRGNDEKGSSEVLIGGY